MDEYNAEMFWKRYKNLAEKDLPVILKTSIKQSTLSTWRIEKTFPRADQAVKIATSLHTSVEFLVTGQEQEHSTCSPEALEVAVQVDKLNNEGKKVALSVVKGLETQFPLDNFASIKAVTE
ncbi:helix-turn-helix domain containing protein [Treponema primitia]|uniref:helix-turn-helix domain-containing protein n=1 Tax=Treponema primitia TaxID=88058 RepID=UPI0039813B01